MKLFGGAVITKRLFVFVLALFICAGMSPIAARALGVAGFDVYRADTKSPDSAFRFKLTPGESGRDRIIIENTSGTAQELRVYAADGTPTSNGGVALKERLDQQRWLAKWITIDSPPEIKLEPGEKREIGFSLSVPENSDSSEKIAGIVIERTKAIKDTSDKQFSINVLPRVAILVTQRVPGPASLSLAVTGFKRIGEFWDRPAVFDLALKNDGNLMVRPTGKVELFNLFGGKSDTIDLPRLPTLFPGSKHNAKIEWRKTPVIGYFTAKVTIKYEDGKTVTKQTPVLVCAWWLIFIIIAPVLAWRIRRRAAKKRPGDDEPTAAATQRAMETLSKAATEIGEPVAVSTATVKATAPQTAAEQPKRRGRPPKAKPAEKPAKAAAKPVEDEKPKRRGRPPKAKPDAAEAGAEDKPKRRGRPPKAKPAETSSSDAATMKTAPKQPATKKPAAKKPTEAGAEQPKRRGRPPKAKPVEDEKPKRRGRPPKAKPDNS